MKRGPIHGAVRAGAVPCGIVVPTLTLDAYRGTRGLEVVRGMEILKGYATVRVAVAASEVTCAACRWSAVEIAARSFAEILEDMRRGVVPRSVARFHQLHDFVDANGYGGMSDGDCPLDAGTDAGAAVLDEAVRLVDEWLEALPMSARPRKVKR